MVTTLRILGDERLLPIDEETRAALGIDENTPLDLRVEGGRLVVEPATAHRAASAEQVDRAIRELRPRYAGMLQKLAD